MSDGRPNAMSDPHEHASAAGAPGASGPGELGYEGEAMIGDEGAVAGAESFEDPFGRPDTSAQDDRADNYTADDDTGATRNQRQQ